ncbi:MAG: hypothetical protein WCA20_02960 [Candidatus Sulfotelmatobacter sp.]
MLELDRTELQRKIQAAYAAIKTRIEELELGSDPDKRSREERQAITDALHGLRTLQRIESRSSLEPDRQLGDASSGVAT